MAADFKDLKSGPADAALHFAWLSLARALIDAGSLKVSDLDRNLLLSIEALTLGGLHGAARSLAHMRRDCIATEATPAVPEAEKAGV